MKSLKFWFPWSVGAIVAAVFVVFFFIGLADGTVSSFNAVLWFAILAGLAGIVGGSLLLRKNGHPGFATLLAWILAVPGLFAALMIVILMVNPPRWN